MKITIAITLEHAGAAPVHRFLVAAGRKIDRSVLETSSRMLIDQIMRDQEAAYGEGGQAEDPRAR